MEDVVVLDRSEWYKKALAAGNSVASSFASITPQQAVPTTAGIYPAGHGGMTGPRAVTIIPYCEGPAGSQFSVRVYAWDALPNSFGQQGGGPRGTWVPRFLAEFLCTACTVQGPTPAGGGQSEYILDSECFCDTISLTQGSIGLTGQINSTGPMSNLIAYAKFEIVGCRYFGFDFCLADTANPVGMNLLFAKA